MIILALVVGGYFTFLWMIVNIDNCRLCGAKPKGEFGCPRCKRTP